MKVLVIGAGVAGVAAAHRARARGAEVRLVHRVAGATELSSGAIDYVPWTQPERQPESGLISAFLNELDLWTLAGKTLVATTSGVVRRAAGADRALLNLAPLAGSVIAVPDVDRDDWDARLFVHALRESAWTRATSTRFELVRVPLLFESHERRIAPHDFAALHDGDERRRWFCERLGNAGSPDAWLVGPWLGTEPGTAAAIARELGLPVGEATSMPGGPAGARFARARQRLLARAGVDVRQQSVQCVRRRGSRWEAVLENGEVLHADAVVVAIGGVAAGGVLLENRIRQMSHASFRLSLEAPVELLIRQERAESVASAHGFDFGARGLTVLEHVGARVLPGSEGLHLAGDVVAGRPNTILMAIESGLVASDEICAGLAQPFRPGSEFTG